MHRPSPAVPCRRQFLKFGALTLGIGGFGMPELLRIRAQQQVSSDTAVILLWLPGGPPHLETYDPKPDAPAEYRGLFNPIHTAVPGMDICELLPLHARTANRFSLIRSIAHNFADHGGGHKRFLTGYDPMSPVGFVNDHPMVGSVVAKEREGRNIGMPNYIAGTDDGRQGVDVFSFGAAYLGPSHTPFMVPGDPNAPTFSVRNLSMNTSLSADVAERTRLRSSFDQIRREVDRTGVVDAMDEFDRRAFELMTSPKARTAFDLSQEPMALREHYGKHPWGQRALLARRLVEAGCSFVTMVLENPIPRGQPVPPGVIYNWDSHAVNGHIFDDAKVRLPVLDRTVTALIDDLYQRGLDRKVLLIVTGEFGRTPRIENNNGRPGRDHWPQAMSVLVSGGGLRMGQVIGATTSRGERPKERPLSPNDLWATAYRHLGIDTSRTFPDPSGRPLAILPYGEPIQEL